MAIVEMVMPKMGESVMEGSVIAWLKKVGDRIEQDESVLEVATDKVDTEVPAPFAGILTEILVKEGEVAKVGAPLALVETAANGAQATTLQAPPAAVATPATIAAAAPAATSPSSAAQIEDERFYSPLVRSIARQEGIGPHELATVAGTGKDGRVTKKDILEYVENRQTPAVATPQPVQAAPVQPAPASVAPVSKPAVWVSGDDEIMEMDRMRKMIAQRMVESKQTSPHVTSFVEADVTGIVKWRDKMKRQFHEQEGSALTFTPIFIEAIVKAIKDYPMINISVDGDKIIKRKQINIGMAVALPTGNLIVPVIKNADRLNLRGLTLAVNDLARRARENKLVPDELQGGTYTISNVGTFGNVMGTPILVQPQVGIMAFGAVRKKPAVIETPEGDLIGIRHMMFLSHSYDHRVVDGALGGMFVRRVADYLEDFDTNRSLS